MGDRQPIVLASASPRRRQILSDAGLCFDVIPADIDERQNSAETPTAFARRTAEEKAVHVAERLAGQKKRPWVIGADTIVVLGSEVLGKPVNVDQARAMLCRLSGQTHTVITGWAVGRKDGPWIVDHAATAVLFHALTSEQIDDYVATAEGMDKAGAYAIQGMGAFLVDRIEGNYFNVVGLPVSHVLRALLHVGAIARFPLP